ncbi:MAG: superoxide dismutase, Ni [Anaerolineaceae bacterium]|nr:superoxide dismutase, Ni [Anaerolineaceae bacterium]
MIQKILTTIDKLVHFEHAQAHCDIPCGIYDPHLAQISALTVIRMVDLMNELASSEKKDKIEFDNSIARHIAVKEEHAEQCKREVRVIWGDYIKQEHLDKYPELHSLVHKIMQLGSKSRQSASRETAMELLTAVNRFAEIFWETKNIPTRRVKAPYKPGEEVVYPVL